MDKKRSIGELAVQYILVQGLLSTALMLVNFSTESNLAILKLLF